MYRIHPPRQRVTVPGHQRTVTHRLKEAVTQVTQLRLTAAVLEIQVENLGECSSWVVSQTWNHSGMMSVF